MPTSLPPETDRSLLERIDVSVDRFEALLKSGEHPQIESFFEGWHDPELSNLLRELLGVELEYRVRRGEKPALVEYHNRFPRYRDVLDEEFPARLGNYDLLELVGLGAFGRVYRGRLRGTNICHAVKILHEGASSSDFDSVAKEFQALAKIKHPSIVTAHNLDIGVGGALAFLAMEYVEGKSLQELLKSGRLPIERVVQVVSEIAQALGAAHTVGIIHRDLKAANVLIDPEWHPHLTDFGLALLNVQRHDRTEELAGTLAYISPEQIRGEVSDPRSDIWSLGVIFYEMLTGETPFHGATRKVLFEQIQRAEPTEPRVLRPDLPPKLQQICLRCLEKDRPRRWSTAYDLAAALQNVFQAQQAPRVHKLVAPLAVLAALVVIAVGLWFYLSHESGSGKSDSDIFFAIESDLGKDPVLQNANIRITVRNAAVTLTGEVRRETDRMRAGAIAGQEAGVRQVTNNLRVARLSLAAKVPGLLPQAPTASLEPNPQSLQGHAPAKRAAPPMTVWTDTATGLMWAGRDNGRNVNWAEAQQYCRNLAIEGYSGWRLPDIEELTSLYDQSSAREFTYHGETFNGVIEGQKLQNYVKQGVELNSCCAWSGTKDGVFNAFYYRFNSGEKKSFSIKLSGLIRALCVRSTRFPITGTALERQNAIGSANPQQPVTSPNGSLLIPGTQSWTDTGVDVRTGEMFSVNATGGIRFSEGGLIESPNGDGVDCHHLSVEIHSRTFPDANLSCHSLIGRIGLSGSVFEVGSSGRFQAYAAGRLYLGVNDNFFPDNTGSWIAEISVESASPGTQSPGTLRLFDPVIEPSTRRVALNGVDTGPLSTPFHFDWGDGSESVGFFPQTKIYDQGGRTYTIRVVSSYQNGSHSSAETVAKIP